MDPAAKSIVAQTVRQSIVDPKAKEEPITFGQALVTYHFMHSEPSLLTAMVNSSMDKKSPAKQVVAEMRTASTENRLYSNSPCKSANKFCPDTSK